MSYAGISNAKKCEIISYVNRAADLITDAKKELKLLNMEDTSKEVFDRLGEAYSILHDIGSSATFGSTKLIRSTTEKEIADRIEIDETLFSIYSKLKSLENQVSEYNKKYDADNELVKYLGEVSETILDVNNKIEEGIFSMIKNAKEHDEHDIAPTKESISNRMKELLK